MKKVSLIIIASDDEADYIANDVMQRAAQGIMCWGTYVEEVTEEEKKEVVDQTPMEILEGFSDDPDVKKLLEEKRQNSV